MEALAYIHVAAHYEELNSSSELSAFRNRKSKALKAVKSIAIAVACITGEIVTGTAAQAASAHQSNNLTITNDTTSEILVFLHQDGDNAAYTRYAYLPACSERRLLDDYTHGWHFSINLNRKVRLAPNQAGALRIFASGYNRQIFPTPCKRKANGDASLQALLNPHPVDKIAVQEVAQFPNNAVLAFVPENKVASFVSRDVASNAGELLSSLGRAKEEFMEVVEEFVKNGNKAKYADEYLAGDQALASALSKQVKNSADNQFVIQAKELFVVNYTNDSEEQILAKVSELRKIADQGDKEEMKRILTEVCNLASLKNPAEIDKIVTSLIALAAASNKQGVGQLGGNSAGSNIIEFGVGLVEWIPGVKDWKLKNKICPMAGYEVAPPIGVQSEVY
ncbi:hypothetical protein NOS3756_33910 [Nostoc sp. NIES-3756]|uniref:hypothetical protein n=1 Tax=Nostoc sp. NIES-3756 TaxID=1751286 RepID=UPI00071F7ACF|nr:hypothetical protein [Nostoc sp. NIES-3756]BAT54422.1 hypothetical protein NOS3756_33910 [Nostoc sp. NIES-3756]